MGNDTELGRAGGCGCGGHGSGCGCDGSCGCGDAAVPGVLDEQIADVEQVPFEINQRLHELQRS